MHLAYALCTADCYQLNSEDEYMRSYGACTNMGLCTLSLTLNICWLQVIVNCLEICRSVNIVSIIYSLDARIMILNFDPRVMTFYWLLVTMSYIGVLLLYVVFLTFNSLTCVFTLIVYMLKSICNHIIDYKRLLTYLLSYNRTVKHKHYDLTVRRFTTENHCSVLTRSILNDLQLDADVLMHRNSASFPKRTVGRLMVGDHVWVIMG